MDHTENRNFSGINSFYLAVFVHILIRDPDHNFSNPDPESHIRSTGSHQMLINLDFGDRLPKKLVIIVIDLFKMIDLGLPAQPHMSALQQVLECLRTARTNR